MGKAKLASRVFLALGCLVVAAEVAVRWAGMVDFPVYDADARLGYIPSAGQQGRFLNRNAWSINDRHMGTPLPFKPGAEGNVLLLGDSIVWGGNALAEADRLGPQLQGRLKARVWPVSAGSWSLQNQLEYLDQNPDVVAAADTVVFVLNSGDLGPASSWGCTHSHPRERPWLALAYLTNKYVVKHCEGVPSELQVQPQSEQQILDRLTAFIRSGGGGVC